MAIVESNSSNPKYFAAPEHSINIANITTMKAPSVSLLTFDPFMVGGARVATVLRRAFERYGLSLGAGLSRVAGRVFRIGHLGDVNELMLMMSKFYTQRVFGCCFLNKLKRVLLNSFFNTKCAQ